MSGAADPNPGPPLTVLVVQPEGELYGACRSLLRTLSAVPPTAGRPVVCFPWDGPAAAAYRAAGLDVEIVARIAVLRRQGLRPLALVQLLRDIVRSSVELARVGRRHGVDVVHSNSAFVLAGVGASLLLRRPHVWHVREVVTDKPALVRVLALAVRHGATVAAAVSRQAAGMLHPRQRLVIVPNGYRRPLPTVTRARSNGRQVVLSLGRISSTKGQQLLVDAFAMLPHELRRRSELWIVGTVYKGNEAAGEDLVRRIDELGLHDDVRFLGYVPDAAPVLDAAHVLCVTTRTGEGFANVALEALAHEVVVVAAARGGIEQLVRNETSGLLTAPGDAAALSTALERVLSDQALRARLVAGGRAVADRYDLEHSAERLLHAWLVARSDQRRHVCRH